MVKIINANHFNSPVGLYNQSEHFKYLIFIEVNFFFKYVIHDT